MLGILFPIIILLPATYSAFREQHEKSGGLDFGPLAPEFTIGYGIMVCLFITLTTIMIIYHYPPLFEKLQFFPFIIVNILWDLSGVIAIIGGVLYYEKIEGIRNNFNSYRWSTRRRIFKIEFTVKEFKRALNIKEYIARNHIKNMLIDGVIVEKGKIGKAKLYKFV